MGDRFVVTDNDVLCGRGVSIARHPGNQRLRALARSRFDSSYCTDFSTSEKKALAEEIINHIKNLDPPGRFLKREGRSNGDRGLGGPWDELTHKEAIKKACQSLRDCNRPDREGYATKVEAPTDVVAVVHHHARSGMSLREHAAAAALAKDKRDRENRTANLRMRKDYTTIEPTPIAPAPQPQKTPRTVTSSSAATVTGSSALEDSTKPPAAAVSTRNTRARYRTQEANLKSDPSSQLLQVDQVMSSSQHSTVTPSTGDATSPVATAAAAGAVAAAAAVSSSVDPLEPFQFDHQTPHDTFRYVHHHQGTNTAVPVSASQHSSSPVQGKNMFEDDCPASPRMSGPGDDLPTASRLVAGLTAPFSPVTWNHGKSTDEEVEDDHKIPQATDEQQQQQQQAHHHVSLGWRPDSGPPGGDGSAAAAADLFEHQHTHIAPYLAPSSSPPHHDETFNIFHDMTHHDDHDLNRLE